ncbi:MAG: methylmalonyl-CoA mutase family protein, partial [Chloroflexota bacterium]
MSKSNSRSEWAENSLNPSLSRFPQRQESFTTTSEIEVAPLYTPEDLEGVDYDERVGYPGEFPYVRGAQASMYRGRLWTMRQYAGYADAAESNRR